MKLYTPGSMVFCLVQNLLFHILRVLGRIERDEENNRWIFLGSVAQPEVQALRFA